MRFRRSKLTARQSQRLLEHFVAGTPARTAAELARVNRNTARLFYHRIREIIAGQLAQSNPLKGEIEVGEALLGDTRQDGRARAAADRLPVFALLKRGDKVYTAMVRDTRDETSAPVSSTRARPDSVVYTETPGARKVLDVSGLRHQRILRRARSATRRAHIDSIENFWSQAKRHLRRYNGIPRHHFHLFLKECEWRFNYGSPKQLLKIVKSWIRTHARNSLSMPGRRISRAHRKISGKKVAPRRRNRVASTVSHSSIT